MARVHSAASLPRVIDIAPNEFRDEEPLAIGAQFGGAFGNSYSDSGNVYGSALALAGINFRNRHIAAGFMPYYASARASLEGTNGFGASYWFAYHFGGGQIWRFSAQTSVGYMSKVAEEKGCQNDTGFFFQSVCSKSPESRTRAEVRATEVGLVFTTEKRVSEKSSLLFAPAAYWTHIDTGNQLDFDPSGNYDRHLRAWNPGFQLGWILRLSDEKFTNTFVFMAGAQWAKYFAAGKSNRQLFPSADLRFIF
jgi:hypothetical protein